MDLWFIRWAKFRIKLKNPNQIHIIGGFISKKASHYLKQRLMLLPSGVLCQLTIFIQTDLAGGNGV